MNSIRTKLVLWVVAALCAGILLALAITYASIRSEIRRVFDAELALVAHAVHLREDGAQAGRLRIARPGFFFAVRAYDRSGRVYFETRHPALPADAPQAFEQGYAFASTAGGEWRVYTFVTPEGNVQVGQPVATRNALARDLALRMLAPMLLLIPVVAGLVAWALNRGLQPLRDTSQRVSARDANRLAPLPTAGVPVELLPLIEQINGLLARLAAGLDGQRAFLADVAHDLRSPVAALVLQARIAERAPRASARIAAFSELKRGIERTSRLVHQLLDFARLEPGVNAEATARMDLAALAREVVGSYAVQAEQAGVDLGADAADPAWVVGAESELRSLIANLVDNALRYAPRRSEVTVGVRSIGGEVELRVTDNGPGIPEGERARVFRRFHRVAGDQTSGSGLGLAIVKAIVERHCGSVALADAQPERRPPGLEVRICLPATQATRRRDRLTASGATAQAVRG